MGFEVDLKILVYISNEIKISSFNENPLIFMSIFC